MPWTDELPDDLKTDPNVAKFKTPADLAKGYVEASKLIGSSIRPPGPEAAPEVRKEYLKKVLETAPELVVADDEDALYKRLGRPEKPEDYTVDESVAKAIDIEAARALAKEAGLTKKQFEAIAKKAAADRARLNEDSAKEAQALKQEWGHAFPDRVLAAAAAARKMGMPDEMVANIAAGSVPANELRLFFKVSQAAGVEAREISREKDGSAAGRLAPDEALAQLAEIRGREEYWNPRKNPAEHQRLVQRVLKLTEMTLR